MRGCKAFKVPAPSESTHRSKQFTSDSSLHFTGQQGVRGCLGCQRVGRPAPGAKESCKLKAQHDATQQGTSSWHNARCQRSAAPGEHLAQGQAAVQELRAEEQGRGRRETCDSRGAGRVG